MFQEFTASYPEISHEIKLVLEYIFKYLHFEQDHVITILWSVTINGVWIGNWIY
jgi:hypothetical protein